MTMGISDLFKAMRLTRRGRLAEATRLVQRSLEAAGHVKPVANPATNAASAASTAPAASAATSTATSSAGAAEAGRFSESTFTFEGNVHTFRVYVPSASFNRPGHEAPVIVMLHGCKQDSADFARGTAMNDIAEEHGCIVVYPEQLARSNAMRCWNWFDPAHQAHGGGEPAMIEALTRKVVAEHNGDASRIYVAGLSAGGAMAAVVAALYPELFAAVGVHSGIPRGAAHDVVSAFNSMRRGASKEQAASLSAVPMIVFHGTADKTVHPVNASQLIEASLMGIEAAGGAVDRTEVIVDDPSRPNDRATTRTVYADAQGISQLEIWTVQDGPHAWSGGDPKGSFTDPAGPQASRAMLEFFLHHQNVTQPVEQ